MRLEIRQSCIVSLPAWVLHRGIVYLYVFHKLWCRPRRILECLKNKPCLRLLHSVRLASCGQRA